MLIRILRLEQRSTGGSCPGLYSVAVSMSRGFTKRLAIAAQHTVVVQMACSTLVQGFLFCRVVLCLGRFGTAFH